MKDKSNRLISSARCQYLHSVWTSAEDFADFAAAVLDRKPINGVGALAQTLSASSLRALAPDENSERSHKIDTVTSAA